jgi:hypothetical protein
VRTISMQQRRRLMVRRHHLAGDADDPETVTRAVIALHAADPASVYLSVLARSYASTLADVARALYERRSLVRWMAMRRTLFVFPREDVPLVQAAVSTPLAATPPGRGPAGITAGSTLASGGRTGCPAWTPTKPARRSPAAI